MYIITARRMICGDVLKQRKGLGWIIPRRYATALPASTNFPLTLPLADIDRAFAPRHQSVRAEKLTEHGHGQWQFAHGHGVMIAVLLVAVVVGLTGVMVA